MMGAWGDVIHGSEVRTNEHGIAKAQYVTVMLRDAPNGDGLSCRLTVFGDTDNFDDLDLVGIEMDIKGLRQLAAAALDAVRQMETA